jgi:hypothetical protein
MSKWMCLFLAMTSTSAFAESKLAVDMNFTKLTYEKPKQGVGKAGVMDFKTASLINKGIVFNINNINNFFNSQIFVRPTFLGFTTQFGNFGVMIKETSILNTILKTELENSKFILDDNQLNFSGKLFTFKDKDSSAKLQNFRLYCQKPLRVDDGDSDGDGDIEASPEIVKSCLNFMTLNGSVEESKGDANLEYETVSKENNQDKTKFTAIVKTLDMRKNLLSASLPDFKSVSTEIDGTYTINAKGLNFSCAKDEDMEKLDSGKMIKTCLNKLDAKGFEANLEDSKEKTGFYLNFNHITIADKVLSTKILKATLSDSKASSKSTTYLRDVNIKCRKETESDLLIVTDILRDCISSGEISIAEIFSDSKESDKKDSSNKNITMYVKGGAITIKADVKFLGITKNVSIFGKVSVDEKNKKIHLTVTDTKLPLGMNSVKLVMYFLKKDLVSKDIQISNNVISITL